MFKFGKPEGFDSSFDLDDPTYEHAGFDTPEDPEEDGEMRCEETPQHPWYCWGR